MTDRKQEEAKSFYNSRVDKEKKAIDRRNRQLEKLQELEIQLVKEFANT
jgi:hypothetical protein